MRKIWIFLMILGIFILVSAFDIDGDSDVIAHWKINEGSGNIILDNVGGFNLSFNENMSNSNWVEGLGGSAVIFNGIDEFANSTPITELDLDDNFTISVWINISSNDVGSGISAATAHRGIGGRGFYIANNGTNILFYVENSGGSNSVAIDPTQFSLDQWYHVVGTKNASADIPGSSLAIYVDGQIVQAVSAAFDWTSSNVDRDFRIGSDNSDGVSQNYFNGTVDDVAIFNRTLNGSDILEMFNDQRVRNISLLLNTPTNDSSELRETSILFNSTLTPFQGSLTNATLNIWNSTGDIVNQTTNTILGRTTNETTWIVSNLDFGAHTWNVLGCVDDILFGLGSNCSYGSSNFSLDIVGFTTDTEVFSAEAFETDQEIFELNVTVLEGILSVSGILNYNETQFTSIVTNTTNTSYTLTSTIDIPLVLGTPENENKSFFWEIITFDGTTSDQINTTTEFQNVTRIHVEECDATLTVQTLNFTAFDEGDSSRINPFYFAGDFNSWLGTGTIKRESNFFNVSTEEMNICISPADKNFIVDAQIEYNEVVNGTTYNTRNHFFQQEIINNQSQDIPLFLLNADDSTSFILKVQDTNLLPISEALITTQRLDVGTGNFTTVQISKTDDNGLTVGFFKTETVDYRFIITKNNVTLLTTGAQKVIPETAPFTLTFTVGADEGAPWIRFEDLGNLTKTLIFDQGSSIVSFTYEDTSGAFTLSRLLVITQNLSGSSPTVCDVNSTLSSAILTCDTGNVSATYTASAFITRGSDIFLVEQIIFSIATFALVVGLLGVFLAWFIILISAFAFKANEIMGIVLMNITVIIVNLIGLVNFGFLFIFGMLGVSIIIIVLLNR